MIKRQQGKIINISSYSGSRGTDPVYFDAIPYNTSKGAINTFTQDLSGQMGQTSYYGQCDCTRLVSDKNDTWDI